MCRILHRRNRAPAAGVHTPGRVRIPATHLAPEEETPLTERSRPRLSGLWSRVWNRGKGEAPATVAPPAAPRGRLPLVPAAALVLAGVLVGASLPHGAASAAADPLAPVLAAYNLLLQDFDGKVDPAALVAGAIQGMVAALGDQFTTYLAPSVDQSFSDTLNGYSGIGVSITALAGGDVIQSVVAAGPADRAGLRSGDLITSVDGQPTAGLTLQQVSAEIEGAVGSTVTLQVLRAGQAAPVQYALKRADLSPPTVFASSPAPGVGLIRITEFASNTADEFDHALAGLQGQPGGLHGLVLDLRNNPGGYVAAALHIAGEIAPEGPLLIIDYTGQAPQTYSAPAHAAFPPTVVLVDGDTASSAEILAGALQFRHAATLVGEKTYGKGSVQQLFQLPDGSAVKITTGKDELPDGTSWDLTGLTPDVPATPAPSATASLPEFAAVGSRTLQAGIIGLDVYGLQQRLGFLGEYDGPDSGIYDPLTQAAVQLFQRGASLPVTGVMGSADFTALGVALGARIQALQGQTPPDTVLQTGLQVLQKLMAGGST